MREGQTTEFPSAAKAALEELELQAARLKAGLASSDDLVRAADAALDAGIYSDELAQVAVFAEKRLSDLSDDFLTAVSELGLMISSNRDGIIWQLLRRYIGDVVARKLAPTEGASLVVREVDWHLGLEAREYVGDSHGLEHIIGLYHAYDDVGPERYPEIDGLLFEACRDWMREYGG